VLPLLFPVFRLQLRTGNVDLRLCVPNDPRFRRFMSDRMLSLLRMAERLLFAVFRLLELSVGRS
jgi:hypothetical protein